MERPEAMLTSRRHLTPEDEVRLRVAWDAAKVDCQRFGNPRKRKREMRRILKRNGLKMLDWNRPFFIN